MQIIGVAGQMRAGKDTVADRLKENLGKEWNRFAFASALKKVFCDAFDVDLKFIEKWKTQNDCPPDMVKTVRESLQFIGDGFRDIMPNIWIKKAFDHMQDEGQYIISDVRYLNEAIAIKEAGGIVVLVWRKDWENDNPNRSEQEVKPTAMWCRDLEQEGWIKNFENLNSRVAPKEKKLFDIFVRNDKSLEELYCKVDDNLSKLALDYFNQ